jgi:hypothetical protein
MRKILAFIIPAALVFAAIVTLSGFEDSNTVNTAGPSAPRLYTYEFTLDTITNAANDTLLLPATDVQSNYEWSYFITRTSISGTANIAVSVQASGVRSGNTDWVQVGVTSATTATNEMVSGTSFHGRRHRIIVDGTGTQSTSYKITAVLKLKN